MRPLSKNLCETCLRGCPDELKPVFGYLDSNGIVYQCEAYFVYYEGDEGCDGE